MADKPSRALVLYGDGLARFVKSSHTHLHSLASKASCGFLTLANAPPSGLSGDSAFLIQYTNKFSLQSISFMYHMIPLKLRICVQFCFFLIYIFFNSKIIVFQLKAASFYTEFVDIQIGFASIGVYLGLDCRKRG